MSITNIQVFEQMSQRWCLMLKFFQRSQEDQEHSGTTVRGCAIKWVTGNGSHRASVLNLGSFQGNGDAVQEDEGQHYVVKKLVSNNGLAEEAKPAREFQQAPVPWAEQIQEQRGHRIKYSG